MPAARPVLRRLARAAAKASWRVRNERCYRIRSNDDRNAASVRLHRRSGRQGQATDRRRGQSRPEAARVRAGWRLLRLPVRLYVRRGSQRGRHRDEQERCPAPDRLDELPVSGRRRDRLQGRHQRRPVRDQEPERDHHLRVRFVVLGLSARQISAGFASARIERAEHAVAGRTGDRREIAGLARGEAVREPRERERLDLLRRHAERGRRIDRGRHAGLAQRVPERVEQHRIACTAAAHEDGLAAGCVLRDLPCDRDRGECREGRLHVLRRDLRERGELRVEPRGIEQVASGAFRRRRGEIRFVEQRIEQRRVYGAARGELAAVVVRLAQMAGRPRVDQRIRGAAVEAAHVAAFAGQNRDVADPAEIADDARLARRTEHRRMERRRERRAVAAGSHVAAAEIGDHIDMGQLGEQRRVVELPRIAAFGAMAHRLAVHADRANLVARQPRGALQFVAAHRVARDERVRRERFAVDLVVAGLLQREQRVAQRLRETDERFREHGRRLAGLETHGDAVDAVHAGSRHQPEVDAVGRMDVLRLSLRHVGFSWIVRCGPVPRTLRPIIRAT
ncbi:hypothetical protein Lal_00001523 [Lupinus albus]|nr:hypothetical protein Lal_00001523 [Lupinus albus]